MRRALSYLLPLVPLGAVIFFISWQSFGYHGMARSYLEMGRDFREEKYLFTALGGVYVAVGAAFNAMVLLGVAVIFVVNMFIRKLRALEDRLDKLESERRKPEDAAL